VLFFAFAKCVNPKLKNPKLIILVAKKCFVKFFFVSILFFKNNKARDAEEEEEEEEEAVSLSLTHSLARFVRLFVSCR